MWKAIRSVAALLLSFGLALRQLWRSGEWGYRSAEESA